MYVMCNYQLDVLGTVQFRKRAELSVATNGIHWSTKI